jgi:hypothetical protein
MQPLPRQAQQQVRLRVLRLVLQLSERPWA